MRSSRSRSQVQTKTNELSDAVQRILDIEHALDNRVADTKKEGYAKRVADAVKPLHSKLEALRDSLVEIHSHADEITLHYPIRYYNMLLSLAGMVQSADAAPTTQEGGDLPRHLGESRRQLGGCARCRRPSSWRSTRSCESSTCRPSWCRRRLCRNQHCVILSAAKDLARARRGWLQTREGRFFGR